MISLFRSGRRAPWLLATALCLLVLLPVEGFAGAALRVAALLGALAILTVSVRHRSAAAAPRHLQLTERQSLGRDIGVALLEAEGRRMVLGYSPSGIAVLADLVPDPVSRAPACSEARP